MYRTPYIVQIDDGEAPTQSDLRLRPLNVEKGSKRFSEKDGVFPPRVATYRNNLTALSQRRNILFVAYDHQIYVWEPAGPRQVLGAKPTMILTPIMKDPDAEGIISRHSPHAINNILVDDLGRDEILLLATDSGNVCGYHVESLFSYIESAMSNGEKRPILDPRIDPFFCESVGLSAWGLAVHKYARLIAISSNTGIITVFAFAIADESHGEPSGPSESFLDDFQNYGQNWLHVDDSEQFEKFRQLIPTNKHRSRNVRLSYEGHFTNIPCICFLNSDLDSEGMWMVSTDIDNRMFVWAIWDQFTPFRKFEFYRGEPLPDILRVGERGWSVLALDPRSFRIHQSYTEACGGKPYLRPCNPYPIMDVTNLVQEVPDISFVYNPFSPAAVNFSQEEPTLPDLFDIQSCIVPGVSPEIGEQPPSEAPFIADEPDSNQDDASTADHNSMESTNQHLPQQNQSRPTNENLTFPWQNGQSNFPEIVRILLESANGAVVSGTTSDDSDENDSDPNDSSDEEELVFHDAPFEHHLHAHRQRANIHSVSTFCLEPKEQCTGPYPVPKSACLYFPILHFSETDIRLLRSPFARHPTVVARGPLRQQVPEIISSLYGFDRFNMVKYLAEFGIVIAATQRGRAAVISLTETADGNIAIRINWMLPLASQERHAERPLLGLLGLAVSPIQGFEKQPDMSHVPCGVSSHQDFSFHYRSHGNDVSETTQHREWESHSEKESVEGDERQQSTSFSDHSSGGVAGGDDMHDHIPSPPSTHSLEMPELTFAESHGTADWTHKPQEAWHGISSSRRYRVLLTYTDHTVMSYEFWYEWSGAAFGGSSTGSDGEDSFLL